MFEQIPWIYDIIHNKYIINVLATYKTNRTTEIPTSSRSFVIVGPLLMVELILVYNSRSFLLQLRFSLAAARLSCLGRQYYTKRIILYIHIIIILIWKSAFSSSFYLVDDTISKYYYTIIQWRSKDQWL